MKKLVMLSLESVFAGRVQTGMAELVDSLANSLGHDYELTIICTEGNSTIASTASDLRTVDEGVRACRFSSVNYYMVDIDVWPNKAIDLIEQIQPDILHNFAEPEILDMLPTRPNKAIYTLDHADYVRGKELYLSHYDSVTTSSENYAREILAADDDLARALSTMDFHGITAGILDTVFSPEKGLMIQAKYNADNHAGKKACKQRLLQTYSIPGNPFICLMMCRLVEEKGLDQVIESAHTIKENGGVLIIVGKGSSTYERRLRKFRRADGVIYIDRWASPVQAAPLTAGADFYLSPSTSEVCGLMPMTASLYGAIPIVTPIGGLVDNFNEENAIMVGDDGLDGAIRQAAEIYNNNELLTAKRKVCMKQDFSWTTRKAEYIELYEKGTNTL